MYIICLSWSSCRHPCSLSNNENTLDQSKEQQQLERVLWVGMNLSFWVTRSWEAQLKTGDIWEDRDWRKWEKLFLKRKTYLEGTGSHCTFAASTGFIQTNLPDALSVAYQCPGAFHSTSNERDCQKGHRLNEWDYELLKSIKTLTVKQFTLI